MDAIDRKLLVEAEKGLPLTAEPFHEIAAKAGITPQEAITRLQQLQKEGTIRRFGASFRPNNIGFTANALVAWKVPEEHVAEIGLRFSNHSEISHCYERKIIEGKWEYNLYTVMHAHKRGAIEQLVKLLSNETALTDYLILYSTRNLKSKKLTEKQKC